MYLKLIKFIGNEIDCETIEYLLDAWRNNGQIISREDIIFNSPDNTKVVSVICPEEDSLNQKWNNSYVNKWYATVASCCSIDIMAVGALSNTFVDSQAFGSVKFVVLFFSQYFSNNPIRDGVTLNPIPLYFIPKTSDDDNYLNILSLSKDYLAFFQIEDFDSKYRENYLDELYNIDSNLNKSGFELCRKIERLINKPVFLYFDHYTYDTDVYFELNRLSNKNQTFIDINNECFQLINVSDRIVSRITPNLLEEAKQHYKEHCKLEPIDIHSLGSVPIITGE